MSTNVQFYSSPRVKVRIFVYCCGEVLGKDVAALQWLHTALLFLVFPFGCLQCFCSTHEAMTCQASSSTKHISAPIVSWLVSVMGTDCCCCCQLFVLSHLTPGHLESPSLGLLILILTSPHPTLLVRHHTTTRLHPFHWARIYSNVFVKLSST